MPCETHMHNGQIKRGPHARCDGIESEAIIGGSSGRTRQARTEWRAVEGTHTAVVGPHPLLHLAEHDERGAGG